jgi:hypothetical protein
MLPSAVRDSLVQRLRGVQSQHDADLKNGLGRVSLPNALDRKCPNSGKERGWQWVFRQPVITPTNRQEKDAGIIYTNRFCNERLKKLGSKRACSSQPVRTPYAIHLLRTYSKMAMIFERSRNYWDTMM